MERETEEGLRDGPPDGWRAELAATLKLAGPVVASELGWMVMGTVDTWMVGHLGAAAVGAAGLANMLFFLGSVFGFGLLLGLDPMVSQAFGAGDREGCRRNLWQGIYVSAILTPIAMAMVWAIVPLLPVWEIQEEIARPTGPFLKTLSWSIGPLFLMTALRHYLQGMGRVRWLMVALLVGNVLNLLGNWILIDGRFGFPEMGLQGSAWSTVISRLVMPIVLAIDAWRITPHSGRFGWIDGWDRDRMARLLKVGLPPAVQMTLEVGVFGMAAIWVGQISSEAMAAHQIVMNLASSTFMVPLGIASAGSVRVGQAIGRRDPAG
ncbi:MAG: MATE family efflux transporter, partial [Isosphaeraceae bacterium]